MLLLPHAPPGEKPVRNPNFARKPPRFAKSALSQPRQPIPAGATPSTRPSPADSPLHHVVTEAAELADLALPPLHRRRWHVLSVDDGVIPVSAALTCARNSAVNATSRARRAGMK